MSAQYEEKKADEDIVPTSSFELTELKQSPVDFSGCGYGKHIFPTLCFDNYSLENGSAIMTNTGHTVEIELQGKRLPCEMFGGPLNKGDRYRFLKLHFRWGPDNRRGSEHSIDKSWHDLNNDSFLSNINECGYSYLERTKFSMEAQAIHWNTRYESIKKCYENADGIVILSYPIQAYCPDTDLADITNNLRTIKYPGSSTILPPACLRWLAEASLRRPYYTYEGSFTTPPYQECVIWIVMATPISISGRQVAAFRQLKNRNFRHINGNCRPQQALNLRTILFHKDITLLMPEGNSPINIKTGYAKSEKFSPLVLNGHWLNSGNTTLSNNGKTAIIRFNDNVDLPTITGGPLENDVYEFMNTHFHWGKENCNGSEHQLDGIWSSMEAHIVHLNKKYKDLAECMNYSDGLAILVYFFLATKTNCDDINPEMEEITNYLKHVAKADTKTQLPGNPLSWTRCATNCPKYYTYEGTYNHRELWNPQCVQWIVFPLMIPVSTCELNEFRKLRSNKRSMIERNCKKPRPLLDRTIFIVQDEEP